MHTPDTLLIDKLKSLSISNPSFWSFKGNAKRHHCHALMQYPAMMVPQMQGALIDSILSIAPDTKAVFDPFVGSGTTLGESQSRGLNFYGNDINPLAILACQVKAGPFYINALKQKSNNLFVTISKDTSTEVDVQFFGLEKWFSKDTQIKLSRIRRAIKNEPQLWARKIFWLTLCTTIRATCNSRSSTYKLHIKKMEDIQNIPCALRNFETELLKNIQLLTMQRNMLKEKNLLNKSNLSRYTENVEIILEDVRQDLTIKNKKFDLLLSSPPYGDNHTTVPYGQFSYLQLQWIDVQDIDGKVGDSLLKNQNSIDYSSLGGSLKCSIDKALRLSELSVSFHRCITSVNAINPLSVKKIASFFFDLNDALSAISQSIVENGYMIWTVGNRRVANIEVPLDSILRELLENMDCTFVHQIEREIPSKRMASKNDKVNTMTKESILIMRKL